MYNTIGYQTVGGWGYTQYVRENAPFKCTRTDAWLSEGYYFWDNDIGQAHVWGKVGYNNRFRVCKVELYLENMLDLLASREHQLFMKGLMKEYKDNHPLLPQNYNPTISEVIMYFRNLEEQVGLGVFLFDSVRSYDIPLGQTSYKFVDSKQQVTFLDMRIQICLFEKTKRNLRSFQIVHQQ